jgi:hypothetical protein
LFDLRPPHLVHLQSQRIDLARLLNVLLFLIFLFFSAFNIGYTAFRYLNVRQELSAATSEQVSVKDQSASFAAAIKNYQALKTKIVAYLTFTREELPAVEFMRALEDAIPGGLKFSSLEVRPGNAYMIGSALSDEEIIALTANLASLTYIIKKVDSPITNKSVLGSRQISDFQVTCDIKPILDIEAASPSLNQPFPGAAPAPAPPAPEGGN